MCAADARHGGARLVWERVTPPDGAKVLDVGTGTGIVPRTYRRRGSGSASLVGCDRSGGVIRAARARTPSLRLVGADATSLPFRDSVFDVVTASFVLSHLSQPETGMVEVRRALKPAGRFVMTAWAAGADAPSEALTHLLAGAVGAERVASAVKQVAPSEAAFETEAGVARALDRAGFTAVAVDTHMLETIVSVEQFLADRVLASGARYVRHVLDRKEWEQLVERARMELAGRFGCEFPFRRGVLIGVGTRV